MHCSIARVVNIPNCAAVANFLASLRPDGSQSSRATTSSRDEFRAAAKRHFSEAQIELPRIPKLNLRKLQDLSYVLHRMMQIVCRT